MFAFQPLISHTLHTSLVMPGIGAVTAVFGDPTRPGGRLSAPRCCGLPDIQPSHLQSCSLVQFVQWLSYERRSCATMAAPYLETVDEPSYVFPATRSGCVLLTPLRVRCRNTVTSHSIREAKSKVSHITHA